MPAAYSSKTIKDIEINFDLICCNDVTTVKNWSFVLQNHSDQKL